MLRINPFKIFVRDYKRCQKKHWTIDELDYVIQLIQEDCHEEELIKKYDDHQLQGKKWDHARDLHVVGGKSGDWLLIYQIIRPQNRVDLLRTGTHDELFGKK